MIIYDRTIGNVLHAINTVIVAYFVVWILVTPFIDSAHFTQGLFPPREYGLVVPAVLVTTFFGTALTVTAYHLRKLNLTPSDGAMSALRSSTSGVIG
jgi:hypothetical protein